VRENYFTTAAVELLSDRTPTVRLSACALLPRLKARPGDYCPPRQAQMNPNFLS
jgi:hypothetical protein